MAYQKKVKFIDYDSIHIPSKEENKDRKKFHYTVRRAEILRFVKSAGHPRLLNQTQLAGRYGVSRVQIAHDMKILKEYFIKNIGKDIRLRTELVYNKVVDDLMKSPDLNDNFKAAKLMRDWNDWTFNIGVQEKSAEKHEITTLTVEIIDHKKKKKKNE